ncbi:MAG TPA: AAA family ATPase, partial [Frankiaceae bacterium]|nr:AAA family ATPase [Frankiaceae bacterium]
MRLCGACGEDNPDRARFCLACAAPLGAEAPGADSRKMVTVVFCDVTGYTTMGEQLDPESLRQVMTRYFGRVRETLESHGGTVEKFIGDAVVAVFGVPVLHEDDALRAARAALDIRAAMRELNVTLQRDWGLRLQTRTGINSGEVVVGSPTLGGTLATGDAVNVAARLEQAAAPDEILLGEPTLRLVHRQVSVEPLAPLPLAGKSAPLPAYRLLGLAAGGGRRVEGLTAPLIGRGRERRRLDDALEQVTVERTCQLFTVLGAAGVGKTRLLEDFRAAAATRATVLTGGCLSYGEGITYWPLMEMTRQAVGLSGEEDEREGRERLAAALAGVRHADAVVERLAPLVGLGGTPASAEESFWAVRAFLAALAEAAPLVLVFDDVHWAEPTLLDLIENIADWSRRVPILLLCLARPELLDERRDWGGGKLNSGSMLLQPLSPDTCRELIRTLLRSSELDAAFERRITETADGNPLFVEQMLAALIDDGLLRREGDRWVATADLAGVHVPPTISALLAARLDRLGPPERQVIERAAVVGQVFYLDAVADLSTPETRDGVQEHCLALVRKELVHPDRTDLPGEEAFRFLHVLLRDCAYECTSKQLRADLHERFAGWLEKRLAGRPDEQAELVGYNLEQAYRYRVELGLRGERTQALGRRAATRLVGAAHRIRHGDRPAAAHLLTRAAHLLPDTDPLRLRAQVELGQVLLGLGELEAADDLLAQTVEH